ncbi:MAG: hypothetical protein ACR2KV_04590 [Solirubrobacteraceae bacterium]
MRLAHELGEDAHALIVLGGLVPEVLAREAGGVIPDHLGTTDVDVLLITRLAPDADLGSVEAALERIEFGPDPREEGWRWRGTVDGATVRIEFLCDRDDQREGEVIRPAGCRRLAALNLRGTGYVAGDFALEELRGQLADGTDVVVSSASPGSRGTCSPRASPREPARRTRTTTTSSTCSSTTGPAVRSRRRESSVTGH